MAKKTKYESSNFDIDADLDLPDFDFEAGDVGNDRNPVKTAAKATLKGAADAVLNPSVIRSTIRKSMPKEYGDALDLVDQTASSMRSLYDTAAKEFRPVANDLKRIAGKVVPSAEGVLPKKLTEALKRWAKTDGKYGVDLGAERQRDDSIIMELGQIFKVQAEVQDKKDKADQRRDQFKEGIDQIRHRDQIGQLDAIRVGIDRLTAYQDGPLSGYQKKSLELQFRQYFATVDLLETQRKAAADIETKLAGILKNTALPEFVKINESERFSELARNKFYSDIRDNLFGDDGGSAYIKKFIGNIKNSLGDKIRNAGQQLSSITGTLDMATDMGGGGGGPSKWALGGGIAGSMAGEYAVGKGQDWLKKKLKDNPALAKGAENISYRVNNAGQLMNDYFSDYSKDWGIFEGLKAFLDENRPGTSPATMLDTDSIQAMNQPQPFMKSTHKSIVEIIPGYLARIHRELQVMRTGDESIGLSTYDFSSNKFTTEKALGAKLIGSFAGKESQDAVRERQDALLSIVDPQGKFTDTQRKAVRDQVLRMSLRRSSTDSIHLTDANTWKGAGKGAHGIAEAFSSLLEADFEGKRGDSLSAIRNQNLVSNGVRGLTEGIGDPRALIQDMINAGQYDTLRDAGVIDENGNISLENFARLLSGEDPNKLYNNSNPALAGKGKFRSTPKRSQRQFSAQPSRLDSTSATMSHSTEVMVQKLTAMEESMKTPATLKPIETIAEMVTSIEKRLASGLIVYGDTTGRIGWEDFTGPRAPDWISKQVDKVKKKWSDVSIGELGATAKNWGLKGLAMARREGGKIFDRAKGVLNAGKTLATNVLQRGADKMGDIYVGSELQPRLTRAKMLAGEYIDQTTGKVLTSLDDIKGPIVDKAGNIVLSLEDLKTAQMRGKIVEYVKDKVKGLGALIGRAAVYGGGLVKGIYGHAINVGMLGLETIKNNLPPYDVYVADQMDQPILYASQFRLAAYFSQKTGQALRHPRDIDGPVLDKDGNILITEDMIKRGIVDRHGIAVSNVVGRLMNKVKGVAGMGLGLLKKFGVTAKNFALGAFSSIGELFKGLFNGFSYFGEKYVEINKDQLDVQLEILKLLQERLPKRATGDTDGDGDRDGSVADILKRRKEEKDAKTASIAGKAQDSGAGGGMGLLGALGGLIKKNTKAVEEAADEADGGMLDDAADVADIYDAANGDGGEKKGRRRRKPKVKTPGKWGGRIGKLAQAAKGAGSRILGVGGRAAAMAGSAAASFFGLGGLLGKGASLAGRTAMGAGRIGLGVAGTVGRLGASALLNGGTLSVARMAVMGLTGALFSPIGLAALGLTAAYYGYKYLTRKTLETLNKVRYVQYGFNNTDNDHFKAVFELEDKLEPHVKLDGPRASLDEKKVDLNELMEAFGANAEDKESVRRWTYWFNERFKPIFLAHKSALSAIKPDVKIADVDSSKLKPEEKLKYLGATELPGGPYDIYTSPFKDLERLGADSRAVQAQIEIARTQIQKDIKDTTKPGTAAAAAAAGGAAALAASGKDGVSGGEKGAKDKAAAAGIAALASDLNKPATMVEAGAKVAAQSSISADYLFTGEKGQMDALTVIRYKTYGLTTMDADKVKALRYLEVYVARNTSFEKDGAKYAADVETLLENVKAQFGISGARSPKGYNWIKWFRARFLPAFLNFATGVEKATKKQDIVQAERTLTPEQALGIANAVYATSTVYEGKKMPVWQVVDCSPWDNYPLNNNDQSIDLNLEALKEAQKAVIRGEHKSEKVRQQVANNRQEAVKDGRTPSTRVESNTAGGAYTGYAKQPGQIQSQTAAATTYGNNNPETMRADGQNVRGAGEFMTGVSVKHPGSGTGGDINSLPDIGSNKGWSAVKPLLLAVAKMTGVDPKVLVNMAAIESGFDPQARPYNPRTGKYLSSAVGLYQFLNGTWNQQMRAHGKKYGIAIGTPPTDARANALMGAEFIKSNMEFLKGRVKRSLTATDVYLAHFLGPGGAAKFLAMDPNTPAASVMQKEAEANPGVFFDRSGRMRTAGEIYKHFTEKMAKQGKAMGVKDGDFTSDSSVNTADSLAPGESEAGKSGTSATASTPQPGAAPKGAAAVQQAANTPSKAAAVAPGAPRTMMPGAGPVASSQTQGTSAPTEASQPSGPARTPNSFGGFQPNQRPSSQEIRAMDEGNRPSLEKGIGEVQRILQDSLGVQRGSQDLLSQILQRMASMPMKSGASSTAPQASSTPSIPKEAAKPAIDMSRGG